MKRLLVALVAAACLAGRAEATSVAFNTTLVNNQVVSSTRNFTLDASQNVIDLLSIQVALSTASPASATFKDGKISGASISVTSATFLSPEEGTDYITVTTNTGLSPAAGSDSILVSSGVAGSSITVTTNKAYILRDGNQYSSANQTTPQTASLIAGAINSNVANVTAAVSGSSVIITCNSAGVFCNSYALSTTTSTALTAASANFTGGNNNASFNLNGHVFYQGIDWFQKGTSSDTAISILGAISPLSQFTTSTNTTTSVQIDCAVNGSFCNAFTLTASTGALTITSPTFLNGQDPFVLVVNGTKLTAGTDFTAGSSSASAANAIAAAMNSNASIGALTTSTAPLACGLTNPCGVVNSSGIITTGSNNYILRASSGVTLSSSSYLGGVASAYTLNSPLIALPGHGMATNMQVLFTGANAPAGLSANTTYYVISVDPNDIELALTSTGAVAGTFITLTSTPSVGGHSFTLAPLAMTGSTVVTLQASDDNLNWSNLSVSASTIAANGAASSTLYDLGATNLLYYRAVVAAAPTGGTNVTVRAYGKRYGLGL